jgi:hypothetical protein
MFIATNSAMNNFSLRNMVLKIIFKKNSTVNDIDVLTQVYFLFPGNQLIN